ncbi:MAG: GGDEF domain-containing protein [Pirellulaceae bacterium]|nr:GGDEF domain-containing protein [Pirellulaceae bacterium]
MSLPLDDGSTVQPRQLVEQMGTIRFGEADLSSLEQTPKKAFLNIVRSKADLGVHTFVNGPTIVGRNPHCSFPLHDFAVSWQHLQITPRGDNQYVLEDLKSTNGTRVNGQPISGPRVLVDGEKIFAGETVIRFSLADAMDIDFHSEVATLVGTDPLTGLESKRRFDEAFEFALRSAVDGKGSIAMLMMDMDGVKQINDTHGHLFGAHVIGETGRLIAKVLGTKGRACRFGGDEFSAFLYGHDLASACEVAEEIRQTVETAGMEKDGIALRPTISIGVACYPDIDGELLRLVSTADEALYRAKSRGKNCVAS